MFHLIAHNSARPRSQISIETKLSHLKFRAMGITLIELLVVLAVLGILSALAYPTFYNTHQHRTANHAMSTLSNFLWSAQYSAILENSTTIVCSSQDQKACTDAWNNQLIAFKDMNQNNRRDLDEQLIRVEKYELNFGKLKYNGATPFVKFSTNGFTQGTFGSFIYCPDNNDASYIRKLVVNLQGRVRQQKLNELDKEKALTQCLS